MGDHIPDTTVVLEVGDHAFIRKQSVVLYAKAARLDVRAVVAEIENPASRLNCRRLAPCTPELPERVRRGLIASRFTGNDIKAHCGKLWNL